MKVKDWYNPKDQMCSLGQPLVRQDVLAAEAKAKKKGNKQ